MTGSFRFETMADAHIIRRGAKEHSLWSKWLLAHVSDVPFVAACCPVFIYGEITTTDDSTVKLLKASRFAIIVLFNVIESAGREIELAAEAPEHGKV